MAGTDKLKTSATFTLAKETPGTYQYTEDGDKAAHKIGAIYVKKSTIGTGAAPQRIKVTIREI